jgi:hypothetical protein
VREPGSVDTGAIRVSEGWTGFLKKIDHIPDAVLLWLCEVFLPIPEDFGDDDLVCHGRNIPQMVYIRR